MKHYKKEIAVNGRLLRPLMVGQSAFLYANGRIRHTLPVVAIHEQMEDFIRFETANTICHCPLFQGQPAPCFLQNWQWQPKEW